MHQSLTITALLAMFALAGCASSGKPEASADAPLDGGAIVRLADRMRSQGDLTMAADFYQRAIDLAPDQSPAYLGLASLHEQVGQPDQAGRYYLEAVRHDGSSAAVRRAYAKFLLVQGQHGAAVDQYLAALKNAPDDVKALNGLGVAYDQLGRHDKAQTHYRRALQIDPENQIVVGNFGLSLIAAGDAKKAIGKMEPVASALQVSSNLRQNLALAYVVAGRRDAAHKLLRRDLGAAEAGKIMKELRALHDSGADRKPVVIGEQEEALKIVATVQQLDIEPLPSAITPVTASRLDAPQPEENRSVVVAQTARAAPAARPQLVRADQSAPKARAAAKKGRQAARKAKAATAKLAQAQRKPTAVESGKAKIPVALMTARKAPSYDPGAVQSAAIVGPFSTDAMASMQMGILKERFISYLATRPVMNVTTDVARQGGTPQFLIRVYGFTDPGDAAVFCKRIERHNYRCSVR